MSVTKRLVLSVLLFLFAFNSFADKKETEHILTEDQETQFNYVFMEGVRCKILGDLKSAITYFDQCMKLYKGSAAVRYELASILALGDDLTLPLQLMREAVKLEPDNIWYKLCWSLLPRKLYPIPALMEKKGITYSARAEIPRVKRSFTGAKIISGLLQLPAKSQITSS